MIEPTRSFKPKAGALLRSLIMLYISGGLFAVALCFNTFVVVYAVTEGWMKYPVLVPTSILFEIVFVVYTLFGIIPSIIGSYAMRIETSETGITYDMPFLYHLDAEWSQTSHIGKPPMGTPKEQIIYVKDASFKGVRIYRWVSHLLYRKHDAIPISTFEGWPDGDLADVVRQYAPHLFEATPR